MMKKLWLILYSLLFIFNTPVVDASTGMHWFIGLTGGTDTSLDRYDNSGTDAYVDGNIAVGSDGSGNFYAYTYDEDLVQAEEPPTYIVPDDNSTGTGCWVLLTTSSVTVGTCTDGSCTAAGLFADIIGLGSLDFSDIATIHGPLIFLDTDGDPTVVGQLRYDNTITGIDDGEYSWYDDDEIRVFVTYPVGLLPTVDGSFLLYDSAEDQWEPTSPLLLTTPIYTTHEINGKLDVTDFTAATGDISAQSHYGGVVTNNDADAIEFDLDAAVVGMSLIVIDDAGGVITIDPNGTDTIVYDGTTAAAGEAILSSGAKGDFVSLVCLTANQWIVIGHDSNGWAETTP